MRVSCKTLPIVWNTFFLIIPTQLKKPRVYLKKIHWKHPYLQKYTKYYLLLKQCVIVRNAERTELMQILTKN